MRNEWGEEQPPDFSEIKKERKKKREKRGRKRAGMEQPG
jgi:hypothetical protein